MNVILLILFGIFVADDGSLTPNMSIVTGQNGKGFATVKDCETTFVDVLAEAKKHTDKIRSLGHSCASISVEPIGQDISAPSPSN